MNTILTVLGHQESISNVQFVHEQYYKYNDVTSHKDTIHFETQPFSTSIISFWRPIFLTNYHFLGQKWWALWILSYRQHQKKEKKNWNGTFTNTPSPQLLDFQTCIWNDSSKMMARPLRRQNCYRTSAWHMAVTVTSLTSIRIAAQARLYTTDERTDEEVDRYR